MDKVQLYKIIHYTHYTVVTIFLVIYFIKTILLLSNKQEALKKISKTLKVPEMIVSFLFLGTGIFLLTQLPEIKMLMIIKIGLVLLSIPLAIIGFKKGNKLLASLSFFMLVSSFGIAEVHHKRMGAITNDAKSTGDNFDAQNYYSEKCSKCHGDDGKAMIMGAMDLSVSTLDRTVAIQVIINGRGTMPATGLSEKEADAIASYVETLRK
ncbi:MAG: cytochrome c [Bacteroidia bacterium]|nr:cytochrome c [Bacteroidia bacterium]